MTRKFDPKGLAIVGAVSAGLVIVIISAALLSNRADQSERSETALVASSTASTASIDTADQAIALTDASVETVLKMADTARITSVGVDADTAYFFIRMKPDDIGGMIEAGTTPRHVGTLMFLDPKANDLKKQTFTFIYSTNTDEPFGTITFDAQQLADADAKTLNYSRLLNLAKEVDLKPVGKAAAEKFCVERGEEAKPFCDKALAGT